MSLLFDHHLSRKLVRRLADLFPTASHVAFHGLEAADDQVIWQFALQAGFSIVSKDSDFNDIVLVRGAPPKVIWVRIGNSTTGELVIMQQLTAVSKPPQHIYPYSGRTLYNPHTYNTATISATSISYP